MSYYRFYTNSNTITGNNLKAEILNHSSYMRSFFVNFYGDKNRLCSLFLNKIVKNDKTILYMLELQNNVISKMQGTISTIKSYDLESIWPYFKKMCEFE